MFSKSSFIYLSRPLEKFMLLVKRRQLRLILIINAVPDRPKSWQSVGYCRVYRFAAQRLSILTMRPSTHLTLSRLAMDATPTITVTREAMPIFAANGAVKRDISVSDNILRPQTFIPSLTSASVLNDHRWRSWWVKHGFLLVYAVIEYGPSSSELNSHRFV